MPLLVLIVLFVFAAPLPAQQLNTAGWFAFNPNAPVAAGTAVDASDLLVDAPGEDVTTIIDRRGPLYAGSDGHFYFTNTGRRAKFFGTNFTFNTSFPPTADAPQQEGEYATTVPGDAAEQLATRLARMGINMVRLHHMEMFNRPMGIFDPAYPNDTRHIDPLQLQRLDYMIYQLKKHGIYVNVNLHVGRQFRSGDGVEQWNLFSGDMNKAADMFDAHMIELEKEYANNLLGHKNPYTGLRLADDPAVAFVEISNEDSLLYYFGNDNLNYDAARSSTLPPYYSTQLDVLWNQWLAQKYQTDSALASVWQGAGIDGPNTLTNGGFESDLQGWGQNVNSTTASALFSPVSGAAQGARAAQVQITKVGDQSWYIQLLQRSLTLEQGQRYELTFSARVTQGAPRIDVGFQKDIPDWDGYADLGSYRPGSTWTTYKASFRSNYTNHGDVMLVFNLGAAAGTVQIDAVSFRAVAPIGLAPNESVTGGTVVRPAKRSLGGYSDARARDLMQFYFETERAFFQGMRSYLRDTLGSRALVTGTAPFWFYAGDMEAQAPLDFIDGHLYHDHPWWPNVPAWSATGWVIGNQPFIQDPLGPLFRLAASAVAGKPYTVSEFNQPFPNDYQAEGLLWMSTFGNLQDWDEILEFDYGANPDNYFPASTSGFFSLAGNATKSAEMPAVTRAFLGSQNAPAAGFVDLVAGHDELMLDGPSLNIQDYFKGKGVDPSLALKTKLRLSFQPGGGNTYDLAGAAPAVLSSDHNEVILDKSDPARAVYKVASESLQAVSGFMAGQTIQLPLMSVRLDTASAPYSAIILQPVDRRPLLSSERMLLTVVSRHQNTGMVWNSTRTSVDNRWGIAPTIVEPVVGTLSLRLNPAVNFHVYALDSQGKHQREVAAAPGEFDLPVDTGGAGTTWYEIAADAAAVRQPHINPGGVVAWPQAAGGQITPGGLMEIYGSDLAPSLAVRPGQLLTVSLAGTSVLVNGIAAPLYFVSPAQIDVQVPFTVPPGAAQVQVVSGSHASAPVTVQVAATSPAIFIAMGTNGSSAVRPGDDVVVYCAGLGAMQVTIPAGTPQPLVGAAAAVTAKIGAAAAVVDFAGTVPGWAGLHQVKLKVPPGTPAGPQALVITAGGNASNAFTITIAP